MTKLYCIQILLTLKLNISSMIPPNLSLNPWSSCFYIWHKRLSNANIAKKQTATHYMHPMAPNNLPNDQNIEEQTYVKFQVVCGHIQFYVDVKQMLHPHISMKKTSYSFDLKKGAIFRFQSLSNVNVYFFHYKDSSYLRKLFRFKRCWIKIPQEGFRIKWHTPALSTTLLK